jgi:hypothetical protein
MSTVRVISGTYRHFEVTNQVFELVKGPQQGAKGWFVTVESAGFFGPDKTVVRIRYETPECVELEGAAHFEAAAPFETDEEVMNRIDRRFEILDKMTMATVSGAVRAMLVTGPPGVGKSFGVENQLEKYGMFEKISGARMKYEIVKGALTPLGLYLTLYRNSDKNNVIVFDDADNVFFDDTSLNLLKAALDTSERRRICWNSESRILKEEGIPNTFDFKGAVIFVTNLQFGNIRSKRLQDHLAALESRCHFVDLTINTDREKMLRIRSVIQRGTMLDRYDFSEEQRAELSVFFEANANHFRNISLRTVIKLADLMSSFPNDWQEMARVTCMTH